MKYEKQGFTLVELLAVIVVLGLILSIAIPRITELIENARINAYIQNEEIMIRSTMNYIALNEEELPNEIGETKQVSLEQLQTDELISVIKDPNNKNEECNGYILITKIEENKYDYTPHLKCGDSRHIGSSFNDGLILHYKFNDFQEPTINLVNNPDLSDIRNDYYPAWDSNLNGSYRAVGWSGGYNGGVSSPSIGYHAHVSPICGKDDSACFQYINENSQFDSILRHRWLGITQLLASNVSTEFGWGHGTEVTVSFDMKVDHIDKGIRVGLYHRNPAGNNTFSNDITTIFLNKANSYQRVSATFILDENDWNFNDRVVLYIYGHQHRNNYEGRGWVDNIQVETKGHATPFVIGQREGIIRDYSLNNNHTILEKNTTPKWVEDSIADSGSYAFDGIETFIRADGPIAGRVPVTISAWVKPNSNGYIINQFQSTGTSWAVQYSSGNILIFNDTTGVSNQRYFHTPIPHNEWSHFAAGYKEDGFFLYVNGELVGEGMDEGDGPSSVSGNLFIGQRGNETTYFGGKVDDVRVYERVLNPDEINLMYKTKK